MIIGKSLAKMNRGTTNAFIAFLVWIVFFYSTSCNAFVLGVQALRNPKTLNKYDSISFETISKNGNSHAIDEMNSSALNPATHETSLFLLRDKDNSEIVTPSLLLPFDQDNSAIMTATHASLLLPFNQDNPAIMTATQAQNLLLLSVQDDPAITMTNHANPKLQLIVECLFLLHNEDNSETMTSSLLLFLRQRRSSNYDDASCQLLTSVDC
jgi:hypothetical protein